MPFRYRDELTVADIAFEAEGKTLEVMIEEPGGSGPWHLHARAVGQRADPGLFNLGPDVKAVTFYRFAVSRTVAGWKATVVLDA